MEYAVDKSGVLPDVNFMLETSHVVSIVEGPSGYVKVFITLLIVEKWGVKIVAIFESFAYRIAAN
jgi:hypothetical protein